MELAHSFGSNGPEIELFIFAIGMLVLAIVFFVQKTVKPIVSVVLLIGAFVIGAGSFALGGDGESDATSDKITIVTPEADATVPAGEPVEIRVELLEGVAREEGGHFDIQVDGEVADMTSDPGTVVELEEGEHDISAEYVSLSHESFDPPIRTEITVTAE